MMPSLLSANIAGPQHAGYSTDAMLNELSRHLAASSSRRYSRGSAGQRPGNAMRITKPSSANNSPQSALQARRRTMMAEGLVGRTYAPNVDNAYLPTPGPDVYHNPLNEIEKRSARPLSWHPSTHQLAQLQLPQPTPSHYQLSQYAFPTYNDADFYPSHLELPPTPAAYSGYASPASTFSPLSQPYSNFDSQSTSSRGFFAPAQWNVPSSQAVPSLDSTSCSTGSSEPPSALPLPTTNTQRSSMDWSGFTRRGFDHCSAPPTPENLAPVQQPSTKIAAEEANPFPPLDEDDDSDGEILYGMGLYDAPERPVEDAHWRFHKSTVLSLLGGEPPAPKPAGRGLKLEDAWEPPASDDEEEEEDEADGDDQDDE